MKRLLAAMLGAMLLCTGIVHGESMEVGLKNGHLTVSNYSITDLSDKPITALEPNGSFKVKATFSLDTGEREVALIAALYTIHGLKKVSTERAVITGERTVSTGFTLPENLEGAYTRILIWDNLYSMESLFDETVFPSSNADIKSLRILSKSYELQNGGAEADLSLPPSFPVFMDPVIETSDKGARSVVISKPESFPGDLKVKCIASDGTEKNYVFHCSRERGTITNLKDKPNHPSYYKIGTSLMECVDPAAPDSAKSLVYGDRTYFYSAVPTALRGAAYISTSYTDRGSGIVSGTVYYDSSVTDYLTFDINQSADVYVLYNGPGYTGLKWLQDNFEVQSLTVSYSDASNNKTTFSRVYKRRYSVPVDGHTTVSLGSTGSTNVYTVAVKWLD